MKLIFEMMHQAGLSPALEADVQDGKMFAEKEYEFYVELDNFEMLYGAKSMDMQEQWNLRIPKKGNFAKGALRVRKIQGGDVEGGASQKSDKPVQYVMTTKVIQGQGDRLEVPVPVTVDSFNLFAMLSDSGMIKHRYLFPVKGTKLVYEVDMYLDGKGGYHPWAKIDLEVKEDGSDSVPPLPFAVKTMIRGDSEDQGDRDRITQLYDDYFITKNKFIGEDKVAMEGFFGNLFGGKNKKEETKSESIVDMEIWVDDHYRNGKLRSDMDLYPAKISSRKAAMLFNNTERAEGNLSDIAESFKSDVNQLMRIYNKYKSEIKRANSLCNAFSKETWALVAKDEDRKNLTYEKLKSVVMKYRGKLSAPIVDASIKWVGSSQGNFGPIVTTEKHSDGIIFANDEKDSPKIQGEFKLRAVHAEDSLKLWEQLQIVNDLVFKFEDIRDEMNSGIDPTDPPFRAFSDVGDDEYWEVLNPYCHPTFPEKYVGLVDVIANRLEWIQYGILVVLKESAIKKHRSTSTRGVGDHEYRGDYTSDSAKIPVKN